MNSIRDFSIRAAMSVAVLLSVGLAEAADSGFYVGGSIGQSTLKVPSDITDVPDFDEDDTGYKIFAGYNFNLALFNFGVEGGYTDFGKPSAALDTDTILNIDADGWSVWGMGGLNFGPLDVFAKVGTISWDASVSIDGIDPDFDFGSNSDSGTDVGYGLGARLSLGRLSIRGEWEAFDIEDTDDVFLFSLGLAWQF